MFLRKLFWPILWLYYKLFKRKKVYVQKENLGIRKEFIMVTGDFDPAFMDAAKFWAPLIEFEFWFDGGNEDALANIRVFKVKEGEPSPIPDDKIGWASWGKQKGKIWMRESKFNWWQLWAHELGHCDGLLHSDNPQSIMYPTILPFPKLTEEIKEVYKKRGLQ